MAIFCNSMFPHYELSSANLFCLPEFDSSSETFSSSWWRGKTQHVWRGGSSRLMWEGSLTQFEGCKDDELKLKTRQHLICLRQFVWGGPWSRRWESVAKGTACVKCGSYYWKLGSGQIRESDETAKVTVRPAAACRDPDPASAPCQCQCLCHQRERSSAEHVAHCHAEPSTLRPRKYPTLIITH